ncbi:MAG TPA: AraC family transcriptional regulator ligand-binding domain-containing protein, partial [Polyangiaceae bacterium]
MSIAMPTRTSRAVAGISGAIVEPVVAVLADMGYAPASSALPATAGLVDGSAADRFIDQAARTLADDALGLHVAERVPMGSLGLVDYALVTSATVREALVRVTRHYGVVTQRVRLSLVEDGAHAVLAFERLAGLAHSRHWMEFSYAIMTERMRQTLGAPIAVEEVSFSHEAPPDTRAHHAFFGV